MISFVEDDDSLRQDVFHDMAVDIREPELPTLVRVGQTLVIKAEAMENRRL